jgi:hypothetical protein
MTNKDTLDPRALLEGISQRVTQDVCELPDYNSPGDQPDVVMATVEELALIVERAVEPLAQSNIAMSERIAELEGALKPFADLAEFYDPPEQDDDLAPWDFNSNELNLGHLRAARFALTNTGEDRE